MPIVEMTQFSFLWPDKQSYDIWNEKPTTLKNYIEDLGFDKILEDLFPVERTRFKIEKIFYKLTDDENTLVYRLDIMEDFIENEELCIAFNEFNKRISDISRLCKPQYVNVNTIYKDAAFYEAARAYINLIDDMKLLLIAHRKDIKSKGLNNFTDLLEMITSMDIFCRMKADVERLHVEYIKIFEVNMAFNYEWIHSETEFNAGEKLSEIVFLEKEELGQTLLSKINNLCTPFCPPIQSEYISIFDASSINRLEDIILKRLNTEKPEFFELLRNFSLQYDSYPIDHLSSCSTEISFYYAFATLICKLKYTGIAFCKPCILNANKKVIRVEGSVDLGLALQVLQKKQNYKSMPAIVDNNYLFDDDGRIFIVTGPNRGGKTTFTRSVGINQVLCQVGCHIPARSASISPVDAIYTHFPVEETLGSKKGRLGEEAERLSLIFEKATENSLILLNETFSSTRRIDGYHLGRDLTKAMMKLGCLCIFVTHFNELAFDIESLNREVPEGSKTDSLIASVNDIGGKGLSGERTYKIHRMNPSSFGYSRDIVFKHGLTLEQLTQLLKERGYLKIKGDEKNA